jgi:hypothetical protein
MIRNNGWELVIGILLIIIAEKLHAFDSAFNTSVMFLGVLIIIAVLSAFWWLKGWVVDHTSERTRFLTLVVVAICGSTFWFLTH